MAKVEMERVIREALVLIDRERIEHNTELLRQADLATLFRLRDAAKIMESCGYILEPLEASSMFEYVIKERQK